MSTPAREARLAAGLTSAQAAKQLGYTVRYFLALERGEYAWPYDKAVRAARLYDCRAQVFSNTRAMRIRDQRSGRGRRVAAPAPARETLPTEPRGPRAAA